MVMVTKEILVQYIDLTKEVKEVRAKIEKVQKQIARIEQDGAVIDTVRGGYGGTQTFKIEGFPYSELSNKKSLLNSRIYTLEKLETQLIKDLNKVEEFIASINDSHIRRIVNLRVVEGMSWNKVADKIGGGNTEDSVRMAFERYIKSCSVCSEKI